MDVDQGWPRRSFLAWQVGVEQEAFTACCRVREIALDANGNIRVFPPEGSGASRPHGRCNEEGGDEDQSRELA